MKKAGFKYDRKTMKNEHPPSFFVSILKSSIVRPVQLDRLLCLLKHTSFDVGIILSELKIASYWTNGSVGWCENQDIFYIFTLYIHIYHHKSSHCKDSVSQQARELIRNKSLQPTLI